MRYVGSKTVDGTCRMITYRIYGRLTTYLIE